LARAPWQLGVAEWERHELRRIARLHPHQNRVLARLAQIGEFLESELTVANSR
jgi:hypothetical protein